MLKLLRGRRRIMRLPSRSDREHNMLRTHWKIAGPLAAGLSLVLFAEAAEPIKLNVKPGLWEIASEGQINGAPPISDDMLARLTPEQREKFQAAMQASMANAAKPTLSKH